MEIRQVDINSIIPYSRNPRKIREAIPKVAASIREYGFRQPIVVDANMTVIAGHVRLEAAKALGLGTAPVHIAEGLTPEQIKAYRIADNRTGEESAWDNELLALEIRELHKSGYDTELAGLNASEIDRLLSEEDAGEDGAPPPESAPPVTNEGDIWQLGEHRLYCGDALEKSSYTLVTENEAPALLCTDPPYNVAYESKAGAIANDDMDSVQFAGFIETFMRRAFEVLAPGAAAYVFYSDKESERIYRAFRMAGFRQSGNLIWRKNHFVLGRADYHSMHEPCLYGYKPGKKRKWYGGRKQSTLAEYTDALPFTALHDGSYQLNAGGHCLFISGENIRVTAVEADVIDCDKPRKNDLHPTMKPAALIERLIKNSSRRGDAVLDCFGGSGTALLACEKLGRRARLIEKEPAYCDVIIHRWQEMTGGQAMRAGGLYREAG